MPKLLSGLDRVITDFDAVPLTRPHPNDSNIAVPITAKKLLTDIIGRGMSDDPVQAMAVGLQIHRAAEDIELEDAAHEMVAALVARDQQATNVVKAFLAPLLGVRFQAGGTYTYRAPVEEVPSE